MLLFLANQGCLNLVFFVLNVFLCFQFSEIRVPPSFLRDLFAAFFGRPGNIVLRIRLIQFPLSVDSTSFKISFPMRQDVLLKRRPQHRSDAPSLCIVLNDLKYRCVLYPRESLDILDTHFVLWVQENDVNPLTYSVFAEVMIGPWTVRNAPILYFQPQFVHISFIFKVDT